MKNYEIEKRKSYWTMPAFEVNAFGDKAWTDTALLVMAKPKWTRKKPIGDYKELQLSDDVTKQFPKMPVKIHPIGIGKDADILVVFFSNGTAVNKIYVDGILSLFPGAEWFSDKANGIADPSHTRAVIDGRTVAVVRPLYPVDLTPVAEQLKKLVRTWFAIDASLKLIKRRALCKPSDLTETGWVTSKKDLLGRVHGEISYRKNQAQYHLDCATNYRKEERNWRDILEKLNR